MLDNRKKFVCQVLQLAPDLQTSLLRQNGTDFTAQFTDYCLTCRGRVRGTDNSFWLANRRLSNKKDIAQYGIMAYIA